MNTAVVTGAAQGVGFTVASLLARRGYRVMMLDLQPVAARIRRDFGAADVLINNAGISLIAPAEHTSADQWQRVMNVNLLGPFLLCKHLGAQMLAKGRGSIVNVASVAGLALRIRTRSEIPS